MRGATPITRFALAVRVPDEVLDLEALVVEVARMGNPSVELASVRGELDRLAEAVADEVTPGAPPDRLARQLAHALHAVHGFSGRRCDSADPASSYLDVVLARRTGLPILLGVVWMAVGRRLGVDVRGVGWPGRFLVSVDAPGARVFVDPYGDGRVRPAEDLLAEAGPQARVHLAPVDVRPLVARMLTNLKHLWLDLQDWEAALGAIDRLLLLQGEVPRQLRDRALVARHLGRREEARRDLARYLALEPDAPEASSLRGVLRKLSDA